MKKVILSVVMASLVLCVWGNLGFAKDQKASKGAGQAATSRESKGVLQKKDVPQTREQAVREDKRGLKQEEGRLEAGRKTATEVDRPKTKPEKRSAFVEKYDVNKNGVLDPSEKETIRKERKTRYEAILRKFDKNGDGKLDKAERAVVTYDTK